MRKNIKKQVKPYLYLTPALAAIGFIYLYSIVRLILDSFLNLATKEKVFVGLRNYINVFNDNVFWESLYHNLIIIVIAVPILVILSVVLSVFLYEKIKLWKTYRIIVFLPYILSITVVGITFSYIFTYRGVLNYTLKLLKLDFLALDWLGSTKLALLTVIFVIIWKELGFGVILLYSRLMSIPEKLYDAAKIDGANWWQNLIYITIPQLKNIIEFYIILLIITMLSWIFNFIYVMTSGGPGTSTTVAEYYIYNRAFRFNQLSIANAASVIIFVITIILIFIRFRLQNRKAVDFE